MATSVAGAAPPVNTTTVLPTAMATVTGNGGTVTVRALFDIGSQRTFILESIANQLKLDVVCDATISINGFGGKIESTRVIR